MSGALDRYGEQKGRVAGAETTGQRLVGEEVLEAEGGEERSTYQGEYRWPG